MFELDTKQAVKKKAISMSSKSVSAVDLFCGAGGLTRGLLDSGIQVVAGFDVDEACQYAYETNNPGSVFHNKSVEQLHGEELAECHKDPSFTLLCGCAPCQTFSTINQKASKSDSRWYLLSHFSRLIKESHPDFVTMENVPGLADKDVFMDFRTTLESEGYKYSYSIIDCSSYGLPQKRRRLVLLASRHDNISLPAPSENVKLRTVKDAIGDLHPLEAGGRDIDDALHLASRLSDLNMKRMKASAQGGTWKDWDESLKLNCHINEKGDGYGAVYGRMKWDEPSPTITTQFYNYGSGRFGHPVQDRAISLREGALLQTFPSGYEFYPPDKPLGKRDVARLIGNAVPVDLGRIIGECILAHARGLADK